MGTRAVLRSLSNSDWPQNKMGRHADQVSSWAYFEAESKASHFLSMVDTPKNGKKSKNNFGDAQMTVQWLAWNILNADYRIS